MIFKTHTANIISLSRIVMTLFLPFVSPAAFMVLYIMCCISDMVDGYMARRMKIVSEFGSRLDSIADLLLFIAVMILLYDRINLPLYIWIWIVIIALLRLIACGIRFYRSGKLIVGLHTYANKLTGFLLCLYPIALIMNRTTESMAVILCIVASYAAIDELKTKHEVY